MFQVILVSSLLSLGAGAPYVPGNPGAPWTLDEMLIMKAKFFTMFGRMNNAPKHLRLGFHDCIKYADGSGGCGGCLNWEGMGWRDESEMREKEDVDGDGDGRGGG